MRVAVVGMGYVGIPLAREFQRGGLDVIGVDVDMHKVDRINLACELKVTTDFDCIKYVDAVCICVPTPLTDSGDPDTSYIDIAVARIFTRMHKGLLIVLESTTYPGTTKDLVLPVLSGGGLEVGKDFYLAFSPERIDPGNEKFGVRNTPKVIGGITPECTLRAVDLYRHAVDEIITVRDTQTAEMVKLLENTFRAVNIALANEFMMICDRLKINVWDVIAAAKTKPYGFMPFYPGPGVGGHCIPIDPIYLSWRMRQAGQKTELLDTACSINSSMPGYVATKVLDALIDVGKRVKGSRILVLGVAYKKDSADIRESPGISLMERLSHMGAMLAYSDPYVPHVRIGDTQLEACDPIVAAPQSDCVVVVTDHSLFDFERISKEAKLVVDMRNVCGNRHNVVNQ
jgi:UDP-N-acetyl-D-glucosamine dehydrogenase